MMRIALNGIILGSVLFLPWWIAIAAMAVFLILKTAPAEVLFWGFAMDVLYGTSMAAFFYFPFVFTGFAILLFFASEYTKRRLVFY